MLRGDIEAETAFSQRSTECPLGFRRAFSRVLQCFLRIHRAFSSSLEFPRVISGSLPLSSFWKFLRVCYAVLAFHQVLQSYVELPRVFSTFLECLQIRDGCEHRCANSEQPLEESGLRTQQNVHRTRTRTSEQDVHCSTNNEHNVHFLSRTEQRTKQPPPNKRFDS